ncbi:hypothetical protein HG535_0B04120 [Zygotorulaspora mrakii]|uniref:Flavodoxin-like domain-containing protein n=1 Tax=Zygotorulaspora mrakii TaxID=42260 RepID=A0A7H9AY74_ZYGMR|nr:uncharacterized protein HG535_0B04120 [Zygotorulaspora mrakii]QLG71370.1 hypothetical protein HG535_0B04120 [Zygotorulaspora mrakii]
MTAKIAIVISTLSPHLATLAEAEKKGIESAGGSADIYQLPETLTSNDSEESLDEKEEAVQETKKDEESEKEEAVPETKKDEEPEKKEYPLADKDILLKYDFYLFGIPTNLGSIPASWASFWDRTGGLWAKGAYDGKAAGFFVTSAVYGDGQEATIKSALNYLVHHGIIYIPLGYKNAFAEIANIEEIHGGTAWGAGSLCGPDGSREPSELELKIAEIQGKSFYGSVKKFIKYAEKKAAEKKAAEKKATDNKKADAPKRATEKPAANAADKSKTSGLKDACCTLM